MKEEQVKEILRAYINKTGLYSLGDYLSWEYGDSEAILDGRFTAEELEAIAWWMNNKNG